MTPLEYQNFIWCVFYKPEWVGRTLEILEGREVYEEDEGRSLRDYQPLTEEAYQKS